MIEIKFTKAVASGNDFVIVDRRGPKQDQLDWPSITKKVCERKTGVGADGLLLLEDSKQADVKMRVFNPDGSEVEMCGNGSRCIALYCGKNPMKIETGAGVLGAEVPSEDRIKVKMIDPKDIRIGFNVNLDGKDHEVHFVDTGVPHVVHFTGEVERFDVKKIGKIIRNYGDFQPEGTNADFVKILDKGSIIMRTYERGVEDETLACGTGACASAVIASLIKEMLPPIFVHTKSGEVLKIYFEKEEDKITNLYLEGEARLVYKGRVEV